MKPGFIKLYRKAFDHPLWTESRALSKFEAWLDLLQLAAFAPSKKIIRGQIIEIDEGECIASLRYLGQRWQWSKNKVASYIAMLESDGMLGRETRHGETILILCNYKRYAGERDTERDTERDSAGTVPGQCRDKIEEDKEDKERIPPNPQGGTGRQSAEKYRTIPQSPQALRLAKLYGRKPTTAWDIKEIKAFKALSPLADDDLDLVCRYTEAEQAKGEEGRHRRNLATLLNNFAGELDRARAKPVSSHAPPKPKQFLDD